LLWPPTRSQELQATQDGNEATNPTFPQVRSIDGYNPTDGAVQRILTGGVTTSLVLPGSANTMGGEAFAIKHRGNRVATAQIQGTPRYMKMACGENPKNVYGGQGRTPSSRMGSTWVMREKFEAAQALVTAQNDWCAAPTTAAAAGRYPTDLSLDSLTALLRGSLILHTHCYTVWDMEMMIRLMDEFKFNVTAFHHAIEAWKLADVLKARNIVTATFADSWGFKVEAYDGTPYAPLILARAGARVVLKSDHPVLPAETLMFEAAKAYGYGLDRITAIRCMRVG
jgi:imidazolonepropionase-like amidohydrolase